ncbi:unnamed protein product [Phytophthora fragariaefolia]|uniref:Unnamed protein product n=1 Tax=Phytophthora fragariaefolia TaxID=1490495 RepID=A0A9W6XZM2_9STRA|nr:unnamed protein product [Phytophthora fragariaefolia]
MASSRESKPAAADETFLGDTAWMTDDYWSCGGEPSRETSSVGEPSSDSSSSSSSISSSGKESATLRDGYWSFPVSCLAA